ncbi:MAG: STAS domain-containing protein [Deltaproteobacteria bacterium]|nr:STAS domain-containing protein [Deltaproteobacteria bacterium]
MQITKTMERDVAILAIEGHLDTKTAKEAEDTINATIDGGAKKLCVDFAKLEYISSVGLRVLLATMKKLKKAGGKLHMCGMNATVDEVFKISGFSGIFSIFPTRAEALAGM